MITLHTNTNLSRLVYIYNFTPTIILQTIMRHQSLPEKCGNVVDRKNMPSRQYIVQYAVNSPRKCKHVSSVIQQAVDCTLCSSEGITVIIVDFIKSQFRTLCVSKREDSSVFSSSLNVPHLAHHDKQL